MLIQILIYVCLNSVLIFLMTEWIVKGNIVMPKNKSYIIYNILFPIFTNLCVVILIKNKEFTLVLNMLFYYILAIIMYYVHEFRGTNLNFSDFSSIGTANDVKGGYKFIIHKRFIICFLLVVFYIFLNFLYAYITRVKYHYFRIFTNFNFFLFTIYLIASRLHMFIILCLVYYILRLKVSNTYFDYSISAGENCGYIYNFFSSFPIFHPQKKLYLSKKVVDEIKECVKVKEDDEIINIDSPHIIVIMNESFGTCDENVNTNIKVKPYYDSLNFVNKSNLYVNTFGGGTLNTEFEFLTSLSMSNNSIPFAPYKNIKSNKISFARFLKKYNYDTIFLHPCVKTNYNRDKIFKYFGFDELVFKNNFLEKDYIRDFVSDDSMYKEIIKRFEEKVNNNKKTFMFGITMQNHGGYDWFPGEDVKCEDENIKNVTSVESYLSLLHISDNAIKKLIDYFKNTNEHVLLCFFGDHNANFGTYDNKVIYKNLSNYEGSDIYKVPFFIYDNKKDIDIKINNISANFIAPILLNIANIPFDNYYERIYKIMEKIEYMNFSKQKVKEKEELTYINDDEYICLQREFFNGV